MREQQRLREQLGAAQDKAMQGEHEATRLRQGLRGLAPLLCNHSPLTRCNILELADTAQDLAVSLAYATQLEVRRFLVCCVTK